MQIKFDTTNIIRTSGIGNIDNSQVNNNTESKVAEFCTYNPTKLSNYDEAVLRAYSNKGLSGVSREDFVKQVQNEGLDKEINWDSLKFDLANISGNVLGGNNFESSVDFISSQYSVLKNQIQNDFLGEDLKKQMNILEDVLNKSVDKFATQFSEQVGGFLDNKGSDVEKNAVYESVKNIFSSQVEKYSDYINKNSDYANIKSTDNKWLERDNKYMCSKLREVYKSEGTEDMDKNYSKKELSTMATLVDMTKKPIYSEWDFDQNEEAVGLNFGIIEVKKDILLNNSDIKKELADKINNAVKKHFNEVIEKYNNKYFKSQNLLEDKKGYSAMDKNAIYDVCNFVMDSYNKNKNIVNTIAESIDYAKNKYEGKRQNSEYKDIYRYKNESIFFANMYKEKYTGYYFQNKPYISNIVDGWNKFINETHIENKDKFLIQSNNFYAIA